MSEPGPQGQPDDALVDLLVKQITEGLSAAERRALDALDGPGVAEQLGELERAAAAITLAGVGPLQAPPPALLAKLERQAPSPVTAPPVPPAAAVTEAPVARSFRPRAAGTLGWFAAAACLVLAVVGWLRVPPEIETPVVPPTPAEQRTALLAQPSSLKIAFAATKDPAATGVTGDVVWNPATQKGFMHFVGLKPNDAAVAQYQLWIFDGERDQRYPVDGGVFDIPANAADVVIPIRAAVLVHKAAAFAVTVEKPGGVVVSDRAHVVVLGSAG